MRENGADTEAEIMERYMEAAEQEGVTLTRDEVMDELAADFAGDMLGDADLFAKFSKENRTAAQKLLDSLKEFLAKVKTAFTGKYRDMAARRHTARTLPSWRTLQSNGRRLLTRRSGRRRKQKPPLVKAMTCGI